MNPLKTSSAPVPVARSVRWREFRQLGLPAIVFGVGLLAAAVLWDRAVAPPSLLAEAEVVRTDVRAAQGGTLVALGVGPLQSVAAGAEIGRLLPADPRVLAASLAVIEAEVGLLRANLEPALAARRATLEQERLRLEWMRERVTLASLRARLIDAEAGLARLSPLYSGNIVAEEAYTTAKNLRDGLVAQIEAQVRLVSELEPATTRTGADGDLQPVSARDTLVAAIRVQEQKLRLTEAQLGPVILRAPIDGVVAAIHRRGGEAVVAGEPVVTIAATRSVRLVGFLRQPLSMEPRVGQSAEIRTRSLPRRTGVATIEQVGGALEPVSPTLLAALNRTGAVELGLRVHVTVPAELHLRPGECVDVIFRDHDS